VGHDKVRRIIKGNIAMSKHPTANSGNFNSLQTDTPVNAQKENNNQLIGMAAEQLAILLWKHSMLKKNSKGKVRNSILFP